MKRFPKVIYVKRLDAGTLVCAENITDLGQGEIAVFRLEMREELTIKGPKEIKISLAGIGEKTP